jgi:hypothetical protein
MDDESKSRGLNLPLVFVMGAASWVVLILIARYLYEAFCWAVTAFHG